jgi:hypothetical protein
MAGTEEHDGPPLTEHDRRRIAEIRRELDREFGALDDDRAPVRWRRPAVAVAVAGLAIATGTLALDLMRPPAPAPRTAEAPGPVEAPVAAEPTPPGTEPPRPTELEPPLRPAPPAQLARPRARSKSPRETLRRSLDGWLDATRQGDITAQMTFYPAVVPVYYTWRDVPSAAVLAEKRKVFGDAWTLQIRAASPEIEVADDVGTAVTRFRKAYAIEGPRVRRRGEVLQELRWTATADGWKITSERDAAVLARD